MISGERKKFAIRSARKPMLVDGLSNTVIVYDGGEPRFCHILFDPCLVAVVGKKMPRGVSGAEPAFIQVVFDQYQNEWVISACYVTDWERQVLWRSGQRPHWIKELKPIGYNHDQRSSSYAPSSNERDHSSTGNARRPRSHAYGTA